MAERVEILVDDPPRYAGSTTEELQERLKHALMRRDEWEKRRRELALDSGVNPLPTVEHARWSSLVEGYEAELFRREHHESDRDWTEDLTHENGNYSCWCCVCHKAFRGHKRRVTCKLCDRVEELQAASMDRLNHSG